MSRRTIYEHLYGVAACVQLVGDAEFARHVADLAVACKFIVYPQVEAGVNALKIQIDLVAIKPLGGDVYLAAIERRGVHIRHVRGIDRERIIHICVVGRVIAAVKEGLPA